MPRRLKWVSNIYLRGQTPPSSTCIPYEEAALMDFKTITFEEPEAGIGLLTLNRPDSLNAINLDMLDDMHRLYEHLCGPTAVRVIVLTGAGRGFCSGADLMDVRMLEELPRVFIDAATFL